MATKPPSLGSKHRERLLGLSLHRGDVFALVCNATSNTVINPLLGLLLSRGDADGCYSSVFGRGLNHVLLLVCHVFPPFEVRGPGQPSGFALPTRVRVGFMATTIIAQRESCQIIAWLEYGANGEV